MSITSLPSLQSYRDILKSLRKVTITTDHLRVFQRSTGCDMCKDGSPPGNPSALVDPSNPDIATLTCQDGADLLKSNYLSSDPECPKYQDIASKNCGCPCTICSDGSAPTNPTALVDPSNPDIATLTCQDGADFLKANVFSSDPVCPMYQGVASKNCGCPKPASCAGICDDGSMPAFGNKIFPFDFNQNGLFDDTCASIDAALKSSPANSEMCQLADIGKLYCGCNTVTPVCTPCYGNAAMPNYSTVIDSTVIDMDSNTTGTCGELAFQTMFFSLLAGSSFPSDTCEDLQFMGSLWCDCPTIPPSYDNGCKLCDAGEPASTSVVVENVTVTCHQLELAINSAPDCYYTQLVPQETLDTCCTGSKPKKNKKLKDAKKTKDAKGLKDKKVKKGKN